MKKIKKIVCSLLAVVLVALSLNGTAVMGYYSIGKGDAKGIDPSNNQFKSAKSKVYDIYSVYISGKIKEKYGLEIFHYKAQESGFYIVYTTGSLDTVGKVYEEQNFLWSSDYDEVASNDDGNYLNYGNNCAMVVEMEKGEDYYICIRAYNTKTGSYGLNIAPNEDKIYSSNGGIWKMDSQKTSELYSGKYLCEKQYLTKEQVLLLYWSLWSLTKDDIKTMGIEISVLRDTYKDNLVNAIKMSNEIMALLTENKAATITAELITMIMEKEYANVLMTDEDMMKKLEKVCGADYDFFTKEWTVKCGLVAERWMNTLKPSFSDYEFKYYGSNATTLTGRLYYYGTWQ